MLSDKFLASKPAAKDMEEHGKWLQKHWEFMQERNLVPAQVPGTYCKVFGKQPPATESLRVQHMLDALAAQHGSKLSVVNTSQNIDRACNSHRAFFPCVTPGGAYWLTWQHRYALPVEKLLLQNLPLDVMDLGCNTDRELHSLAGNSMHTRARSVLKGLCAAQPQYHGTACVCVFWCLFAPPGDWGSDRALLGHVGLEQGGTHGRLWLTMPRPPSGSMRPRVRSGPRAQWTARVRTALA